jgi:hypothetical protein
MTAICQCGHPRLAHLEEQKTDIATGKVSYTCECIYCGHTEFVEAKLPSAPKLVEFDEEDFVRKP